ncbi:MAG: NADH-quinone oxidoreductase subunit C [Hyphomicrobiaceae bacterium]|nr:NADH-quinone oxidoreductase subunit C [Hyphomicrobiaceae bacterium]
MQAIYDRLKDRFQLGALDVRSRKGLAFVDLRREFLRPVLTELRDVEGFTHLILLTAVDWIEDERFQLTYLLNNRQKNLDLGLRLRLDRNLAIGETIHDLWPTAATYQRELREMFGIAFPGSPRVDEEFILEGWTDMPPYRRDFDTLAYSQQTHADREGRETSDPREFMKQILYPKD